VELDYVVQELDVVLVIKQTSTKILCINLS